MKNLLFVAVVLTLLAPLTVSAEPTHPNEIGLYTTTDGTGPSGIYGLNYPLDVYLVLTKPTDPDTGIPYDTVNAFECRLEFSPAGNLFLLQSILPPTSINIGDVDHINEGYLEYIVGIGNDWPVTNESVVLIEFTFLHAAPGVIEVFLAPTSYPYQPDTIVYQSEVGHLVPMYPISGSFDAPVFLFEGEAVAVENQSFGSLKALYR